MSQIRCPYCGKKIPENSIYCSKCGRSLNFTTNSQYKSHQSNSGGWSGWSNDQYSATPFNEYQYNNKRRNNKPFLTIGILLLAILTIFVIYKMSFSSNNDSKLSRIDNVDHNGNKSHNNTSDVIDGTIADELVQERLEQERANPTHRTSQTQSRSAMSKDVRNLRTSAEQGNAIAQNDLGLFYYNNGYCVEADLREAAKWFRKAAEQGLAVAQYNLGICYMNGEGVAKDQREGVMWIRKAAEQGHVMAQYYLGLCYYGQIFCYGVNMDRREAAKWFRKAADQGLAEAQYYLGVCYFYGDGMEQDWREAAKWFRKPAEQGHDMAQYYLDWMKGHTRR